MAASLGFGISAVLLTGFGAVFLGVFGGITAASVQDATSTGTFGALARLLRDALGSAIGIVLALLAATLLLFAAGACLSAWLLRGFGAARAWAITGIGGLISGAADALLATSATSLLTAPVATLLPLLPTEARADWNQATLLTMLAFVIAVRSAAVVGLSICSWMLAAHVLRPRASPARPQAGSAVGHVGRMPRGTAGWRGD